MIYNVDKEFIGYIDFSNILTEESIDKKRSRFWVWHM